MAFMEPEIIQGCARVTDAKGDSCILPIEYADDAQCYGGYDGSCRLPPFTIETFPDSYAARYSAPGYLDATDWNGPYDSEEEAEKDVRDMYGDEEEEDDEKEDE